MVARLNVFEKLRVFEWGKLGLVTGSHHCELVFLLRLLLQSLLSPLFVILVFLKVFLDLLDQLLRGLFLSDLLLFLSLLLYNLFFGVRGVFLFLSWT